MDLLFDINPGLIIWTVVSFLFFLAVLTKFAWKPILGFIDQRENTIRTAMEQAEKMREEAEKIAQEHREKIMHAEEECQKIIREGQLTAEKIKEEIIAQAKQQAQQELKKATDEIRKNMEEAKLILRREIADVVIKAVEKILDESLDETRHKKLVDSMIDQISSN